MKYSEEVINNEASAIIEKFGKEAVESLILVGSFARGEGLVAYDEKNNRLIMRLTALFAVGFGIMLLTSFTAIAQPAPSTGGTAGLGDNGIVFRTADSASEVRMQFRVQSWATYSTRSLSDLSASSMNASGKRSSLFLIDRPGARIMRATRKNCLFIPRLVV